MTERSEKVWSAQVLEELTIDLAAIASKGGTGADGGAKAAQTRS